MSNFSSRLEIVVDSRTGERRLKYFREELERTEKSGDRAFGSITQGVRNTISALGPLGGIVASAFSVRQLTRYADGWSDLNARVLNVTRDVGLAEETMRRISDTARGTYSNLDQTAEAFLNNATTLTELGYSIERQLDLSDALNNALVISATKGQQAQSVMMALSRAFALGELKGDNFNSVIQNGGRIVEALADGLGVTTLELRKLASDGVLTTDRVVQALISQMEKLREEAERMPGTIGDGFEQIGNATKELVGTFDRSFGVSEGIAGILLATADTMRESAGSIGDNLETIGNVAAGVAIVVGGRYVGAIGASTLAMGAARIEALRYQAALASMAGVSRTTAASQVALATAARGAAGALAFVGGPLGAAVIAGSALYYFREELGLVQPELRASSERVGELVGSLDALSQAAVRTRISELTGDLAKLKTEFIGITDIGTSADTARRSGSGVLGVAAGEVGRQAQAIRDAVDGVVEGVYSPETRAEILAHEQAITDLESHLEGLGNTTIRTAANFGPLNDATKESSKAAREAERELERLASGFQSLYDRLRPIEASQRRYRDDQELINRAVEAGLLPLAEQSRLLQELERDFMNAGDAATVYGLHVDGVSKKVDEVSRGAQQIGWAFSSSFEDALIEGGKLRDMLGGIYNDLLRIATREAITRPLGEAFGGAISGFLPFEKGGAFSGGEPQAFASGGVFTNSVVKRPTTFDMGLMGEAGPEAIMPLKRGPGGRLGVEAYGGQGGGMTIAPQFNVQVVTPPGMTARTEERQNASGGRDMVVIIDEMMAQNASQPGSRFGRAMQNTWGASRTLNGRG
ncbi:phage tail tape measure protein [Halomonas desiderata]|uniref:tape measure protein n=1 Tax=Billgrantia desiderata TaxID=52021 RepID=UPI00174E9C97|nr:phage tail tape measure protein [Halomonas desiderata]